MILGYEFLANIAKGLVVSPSWQFMFPVPWYESLAIQSTRVLIFSSLNLYLILYVEMKPLSHRALWYWFSQSWLCLCIFVCFMWLVSWIIQSLNCYVSPLGVSWDKFLATQSKGYGWSPTWLFMFILCYTMRWNTWNTCLFMCLFMWFVETKPSPHRAKWYRFPSMTLCVAGPSGHQPCYSFF